VIDRRLPGSSKTPALAIVFVLLVGVLIFLGFAIGSSVVSEANGLSNEVPDIISKFNQPVNATGSAATVKMEILEYMRNQVVAHSQQITTALSRGAVEILSRAEGLLFVVLVPILSFFCLKDGAKLLQDLLESISDHLRRQRAKDIFTDIHLLLAQYIRALVLLALAAFAAYSTFLAIVRAPYPLLLGAIAAPLEFIPMVGPLAGAALILLVTGLSGYTHLVVILVFLAVYRVFQDYVLSPYLLSAGMELHPLTVIFGVMAGGEIAGVPGAFLSVLVLAIARIVYRQLNTPHEMYEAAPQDREF
jgi:predicted PurR-regulated permease PerM